MDAKERDGIIGDALADEPNIDYRASARKLVTMPEASLVKFIAFVLLDRDKWRNRHKVDRDRWRSRHEALCESVHEMCERLDAEARPRD